MRDKEEKELRAKLNEYDKKFYMLIVRYNIEKNEERREKLLEEINILRDDIEQLADKLDLIEAKRKK